MYHTMLWGDEFSAGQRVRILAGHKRKHPDTGRGLVVGEVYTVTDQRGFAYENEVAVINPDDAPDNPWFVEIEDVELVDSEITGSREG